MMQAACSAAALLALIFVPMLVLSWRDCRRARTHGICACGWHVHDKQP